MTFEAAHTKPPSTRSPPTSLIFQHANTDFFEGFEVIKRGILGEMLLSHEDAEQGCGFIETGEISLKIVPFDNI